MARILAACGGGAGCHFWVRSRYISPMLFMVIERFDNRDAKAIYARLAERAA
jgi:hypothetical protein